MHKASTPNGCDWFFSAALSDLEYLWDAQHKIRLLRSVVVSRRGASTKTSNILVNFLQQVAKYRKASVSIFQWSLNPTKWRLYVFIVVILRTLLDSK